MKLSRCITVPRARLGWLLLCIGGFTWFAFGRHADWYSLRFLQQELVQTNGVVISVSDSGFTSGSDFQQSPIRAVRFQFNDSNRVQRQGQSWAEDLIPKMGTLVQIEFVKSRPEVNRIKDCRSGTLPLWAGGVLIFPLFGIVFILKEICCPSSESLDKCS